MRTKKISTATPESGPSFEQAIQRLEKIVAEMEGEELPLEEVLKKYEEGTKLTRFCAQKLDEAEKKIEILMKKKDGTVESQPFTDEPEDETEGKLL